MSLPGQSCCWPVQLERWTLPGQPVFLAWPVLVLRQLAWQRRASLRLVWQLVLQQQVLQLAWRPVSQQQV